MAYSLCLDAGMVKYSTPFCQHCVTGVAWGIYIVFWFTVYSWYNVYYNTSYVIQWCQDTWYICWFSVLNNLVWTIGWNQFIIWWCCVTSHFWIVIYILMAISCIMIHGYFMATQEKCLFFNVHLYSLKSLAKIELGALVAWNTAML